MQAVIDLGKGNREFGEESVFLVRVKNDNKAVLREIGFGVIAVLSVVFICLHQFFKRTRMVFVIMGYKNIFYISGHIHNSVTNAQTSLLHGYESVETYGNITSVNLPAYSFTKNRTELQKGLGFVFEVYDEEVVIRARSYSAGVWYTDYNYTIELV